MDTEEIKLENGKQAKGIAVPMGPLNVVSVYTETGMIGCGAFDVMALDKFEYPAGKVTGVATVEDVLQAELIQVNQAAQNKGLREGMTGREALELL